MRASDRPPHCGQFVEQPRRGRRALSCIIICVRLIAKTFSPVSVPGSMFSCFCIGNLHLHDELLPSHPLSCLLFTFPTMVSSAPIWAGWAPWEPIMMLITLSQPHLPLPPCALFTSFAAQNLEPALPSTSAAVRVTTHYYWQLDALRTGTDAVCLWVFAFGALTYLHPIFCPTQTPPSPISRGCVKMHWLFCTVLLFQRSITFPGKTGTKRYYQHQRFPEMPLFHFPTGCIK